MERIVFEVDEDLKKDFEWYCFKKDKTIKLVLTSAIIRIVSKFKKEDSKNEKQN